MNFHRCTRGNRQQRTLMGVMRGASQFHMETALKRQQMHIRVGVVRRHGRDAPPPFFFVLSWYDGTPEQTRYSLLLL